MPVTPLTNCGCPQCQDTLYLWDEPMSGGKIVITVACYGCGHVLYHGHDYKKAKMSIGQLSEAKEKQQAFTMEQAYEANKTTDSCVVCGSPTEKKSLCLTVVNYCSCVEKL